MNSNPGCSEIFAHSIIQQDSATCEVQCLHSKLINDFDSKQKLNWINLAFFAKRMVKRERSDIFVRMTKDKKTFKMLILFFMLMES